MAYIVFLICILLMEDGKAYKKNPLYKKNSRGKKRQPYYVHYATFKPEKRLGGILVTWLNVMTFGGKNSRLSATKNALTDLYIRLSANG